MFYNLIRRYRVIIKSHGLTRYRAELYYNTSFTSAAAAAVIDFDIVLPYIRSRMFIHIGMYL